MIPIKTNQLIDVNVYYRNVSVTLFIKKGKVIGCVELLLLLVR